MAARQESPSLVSVAECFVFSALTAIFIVVAVHLVGKAHQPTPTPFPSFGSILIFTDRPDMNMHAHVELDAPDQPTADEYNGSTQVSLKLRFTDQHGQSPGSPLRLHWLVAIGGWLKSGSPVRYEVVGTPEPLQRQSISLLVHGRESGDNLCIDVSKTESPFCSDSSLTNDPTSWADAGTGGWVIVSGTTGDTSSCYADESYPMDDVCIEWRADHPIEITSGGRAYGAIPPIGTLSPNLVEWTYLADALLANRGKLPLSVYFTNSQLKTAESILDPKVFDPGGVKGKWAIPHSSEFDVRAVVHHSDQLLRVSPATVPDPNLRWTARAVFPGAFWEANDESAQSAASDDLFLGGIFFGLAGATAVVALERFLTVLTEYRKARKGRRQENKARAWKPVEPSQKQIEVVQDRIEPTQKRIENVQDRIETTQKRMEAMQERSVPPWQEESHDIMYVIATGAAMAGALLALRRWLSRARG